MHILADIFGANMTDSIRRRGYISKRWWRSHWLKRAIRAIIAAGISVAIFYGFYQIDAEETFTIYVFCYAIPLFLIGIIYTGILPLVFSWLHLTDRGSRDSVLSVLDDEDEENSSILTISALSQEDV